MKTAAGDAVSLALREPEALLSYGLPQWETLIAQARSADLLGRLATVLEDRGAMPHMPSAPLGHVRGALAVAEAQARSVRRELEHLRRAFANARFEIALLKGAAYHVAGLATARGRMFGDIDILVPREQLAEAEAALMLHGWATTHVNAYDQRYYRAWMHELPPMMHVTRGTTIDVHHAILPLTARLAPESAKLLQSARVVPGESRFLILAPADMVLHSATHVFYNEQLDHGLRDLADIDALLREFDAPAFWQVLVGRAAELDLLRPLYYAFRYVQWFFATPIPPGVLVEARSGAPAPAVVSAMDALFSRALAPPHPSAGDRLTPAARALLYLRAHWLRMPPHLLLFHLTVKTLRRNAVEGHRAPA